MMSNDADIIINYAINCSRCGEPGACQNGLCLSCINKALKNGEYDHIFKNIKKED